MSLILIKFISIALCIGLKLLGEIVKKIIQIVGIPIVLVVAEILIQWGHKFDWFTFANILMWIPIDLGYKDYGKNDQVDRASWLAMIAFIGWLEPTFMGHLNIGFVNGWFLFVPYIALVGAVGRWVRRINNLIGAPINAIMISLPIIIYHPII